jgi:CRISPR-associated exonuclease Cas4
MYSDEQLIQLSGIQHISFCQRQFMLIHAEHCWTENILTAQGRILHDNAHDPYLSEKRKNLIITRAMPIVSYSLGLIGEADVVEFRATGRAEEGVELKGKEGKWVLMPIEYKRGKPKIEEHDRVQLCARLFAWKKCWTFEFLRPNCFIGKYVRGKRLSLTAP